MAIWMMAVERAAQIQRIEELVLEDRVTDFWYLWARLGLLDQPYRPVVR